MSTKCLYRVSAAAGAMAGPIWLGSLMPMSMTLPIVASVTTMGPLPFATTSAPEPVTVYWEVDFRWMFSSIGYRNCRSAA